MLRLMTRMLVWFLLLTIVLPVSVGTALGYARGWPENWKVANWASSGLLPEAQSLQPATMVILATRTGGWKSIFAEHMSIILKRQGDRNWTRYDVVGWGAPVRKNAYAADAFWYGNAPRVIYRAEGPDAAKLIPAVEGSIARYPFQRRGSYSVWPGPNSNTFVSWVVRHTPGLGVELPPVAIGKDWLGGGLAVARAPSNSGFTLSLAGLLGLTLAWDEGLELHLLGATIGIDPADLAIKLPALGRLSLLGAQG